jgi:DNA-binding transcriptional LysR family regulator
MRSVLDVRRLQVLTAVVDSGSLTGAAAALGYTPSAVSQSMATLERETATVLLEKSGRGIRPTQAGLLLAEHAEKVLASLREAEAALSALRAGQEGRLRLATFSSAGATLVPRALARFRAAHRAVELDMGVAETDEALAQLRTGRIDVAVIASDARPDADLLATHLLDDPYRTVVPDDHRLARRRSIALADLADDSWIVTASPHCNSRTLVTSACARAGFTPRISIEADEFATAVGFVGAGLGVALVPLLALGAIPGGVRVHRLRGGGPTRHVHAVTRRSAADQTAVRAMLVALVESARRCADPAP